MANEVDRIHCATCAYFQLAAEVSPNPLSIGECHRLPPQNFGARRSAFARVEPLWWCGEWRPGEREGRAAIVPLSPTP